MILNVVEKLMVNNPVRALIQRSYEARRLLRMGGRIQDGHALEIGCGNGTGVEIIQDVFGASRVDAFDLDPDMVARARKRLAGRGNRVRVFTGDAERIDAPDETYDAVFDFGIIHHIPNWPAAVEEIHRVLKPGGHFYADEVLRAFILNPVWKTLLDHPLENRFDLYEFRAALEKTGLHVLSAESLGTWFGFYFATKTSR